MKNRRLLPMFLLAFLWMTGGTISAQDNALDRLTIQDGVCQIGTAQDLANFALAVNAGNTSLDAVVTQDLDFAGFEGEFTGIALDGVPYVGTFDGQGHRILNMTIDGKREYFAGLFRMVGDGCVIKNLTLDKTCAIINGSNACAMVASNYNKADAIITLIGLGNEGRVESSGQYVGAIAAINYSYRAFYIIQDCWATGSVTGGNDVAQLCGHLYHGAVSNCWSTATVTCNKGQTLLFDVVNDATITNCYSLGGSDVTPFTSEDLASGALCYKLNGDQTDIHWTQTIGTDAQPQYGTGSKQVYATGELRCDGAEYPDKPLSFNNTDGTPTVPDHQFDSNGICTVCGRMNVNEDGYYLIGDASQLNIFAQKVREGQTDLNALLTADIDLTASDYPMLMIGTSERQYRGTFDGGGHTVTCNYGDVSEDYSGLFRFVDSATIRNLTVNSTASMSVIFFAGLVGRSQGNLLVENVTTYVDITGVRSGVTGNSALLGANYGDATINNCATHGTLGGPGSSMYCGIVAWEDGDHTTIVNNSYTTCSLKEDTGLDYCYTLCRMNGTVKMNNCYYLNEMGEPQGTAMTEEQFQSGEVCYRLNGDQTDIRWTQTIGTDLTPQCNTASKRVYASGTVRCDGATISSSPLSYSNTESYITKPDHQFGDNGLCIVCGMADPDAVKQNEEGYYLIGSPKQLNWLVQKVAKGETKLNVLLTEDIDLTASDYPMIMIGTSDMQYGGIFDGGGHTVTCDYGDVAEDYSGLFRFVDSATIRNLTVNSTASMSGIFFAGLVGRSQGNLLVENVVTYVDITGTRSGVTGNSALLGANYGNATINNCATHGTLGAPGSSMYCGIMAWDDGSHTTTVNNCYTTCSLKEDTDLDYCYTLCRMNGTVIMNNCYYQNAMGVAQGTAMTEEQFLSGEVCYRLNGNQSRINWYQTIGEDEFPVPDATHARVFGAGNIYMNITDDASFKNFISTVITDDKERYEEMKTQKTLVEDYIEALEALRSAPNIDAFLEEYGKLDGKRQNINRCGTAYSAYIAKVEETKTYLEEHPDLDNEKSQLLYSYLTEYDDPSDDFPNGSAVCILENCELNEEEIIAETTFVDEKLVEAISYTPAVGTDITLLFTNTDFSDGFNGWEGKPATAAGSSETSPIRAAECYNNTMDMYQTLTGLQNGIYELQVNGAFRPYPYNDYYHTNYAATLYANGIHNYFQANIEDMIPVADAIDGENCNITGPIADFAVYDMDDRLVGYTMQGVISCCNAFQGGRYPNSVLCNVTDGTLTIGIRQPGSGQQPDWLGFGNIKVIYWGEMNDANEGLDHVLASQADRASTILDTYQFSYGLDYATYPNFSQALKDELRQTLEAVATTTEPEAKYQLIERFSTLFLQIYECKKAYITLMDKAEEVNNLEGAFSNILSDSDFKQLEALYQQLSNAYIDGTMTAEEALAVDLKSQIGFYPDQEDGYFLLSSFRDFYIFATLVNSGTTQINAKLLTDIDLTTSDFPTTSIGLSDAQFSGIFDGGGHTITCDYGDVAEDYYGIFRFVDSATIRNLTVNSTGSMAGIFFAGLVGRSQGNLLVENVTTYVDITGVRSGVTGNSALLGANYGNATINNCATHGTLGGPGSSMYCGIVAWEDGSHTTTVNNSYTTCTLKEGTGLDYCYTLCRMNGTVKMNNCYYLNKVGVAQGTAMTEEQFQNGEVCYKLNGDQTDIHWFQTIGEDPFPVLDESHLSVIVNEDGTYGNTTGLESITAQQPADDSIYNLQGQKVEKARKGLYIIGRKKVMVK